MLRLETCQVTLDRVTPLTSAAPAGPSPNCRRAACELTCRALAAVSRQSDVLWSCWSVQLCSRWARSQASLAWLAAHRVQHLSVQPSQDDAYHVQWLYDALAAAPRLLSLEASHELVDCESVWEALGGQLRSLSLVQPANGFGGPFDLPAALGQLHGLHELRLSRNSDAVRIWPGGRLTALLADGCIPAGLRCFGADGAHLRNLRALAAAAGSLCRLELSGCVLPCGEEAGDDEVRPLLRALTALTYLALEELEDSKDSGFLPVRLMPSVAAAGALRVLRLSQPQEWTGARRVGQLWLHACLAALLARGSPDWARLQCGPPKHRLCLRVRAGETAARLSSLTALSLGFDENLLPLQRLPPSTALHTLRVTRLWDLESAGQWARCAAALRQLDTLVIPPYEVADIVKGGQVVRLPSVRRLVLVHGCHWAAPGGQEARDQEAAGGCEHLTELEWVLPSLRDLVVRLGVHDAVRRVGWAALHLDRLLGCAPHIRLSLSTCHTPWERAAGAPPCPCCI